MSPATFTLSAFGDEIAVNLFDQLSVLNELQIDRLELRTVWGKNVLELDDEEAHAVAALAAKMGVQISAIGSPIGKSPIGEPMEGELRKLSRILRTAAIVGTRQVRIFSYYPPVPAPHVRCDDDVELSIERLAVLADYAALEGYELLLENEKEIVGDTIERCARILCALQRPNLRFAWDPANFVQVGEADVTARGWPVLGDFVGSVHIKDAFLCDGTVCAAGEGDGQVSALLAQLQASGYQGVLALEPHLAVARHSSGFSGPEGMAYAVKALRALMEPKG